MSFCKGHTFIRTFGHTISIQKKNTFKIKKFPANKLVIVKEW